MNLTTSTSNQQNRRQPRDCASAAVFGALGISVAGPALGFTRAQDTRDLSVEREEDTNLHQEVRKGRV